MAQSVARLRSAAGEREFRVTCAGACEKGRSAVCMASALRLAGQNGRQDVRIDAPSPADAPSEKGVARAPAHEGRLVNAGRGCGLLNGQP